MNRIELYFDDTAEQNTPGRITAVLVGEKVVDGQVVATREAVAQEPTLKQMWGRLDMVLGIRFNPKTKEQREADDAAYEAAKAPKSEKVVKEAAAKKRAPKAAKTEASPK